MRARSPLATFLRDPSAERKAALLNSILVALAEELARVVMLDAKSADFAAELRRSERTMRHLRRMHRVVVQRGAP